MRPEQTDEALAAALSHPVADFLRTHGVDEDERRYLLAWKPIGKMLADIVAAHHSPPRDGELGIIDINQARALSCIREEWGRWNLDQVRDALPEFGEPEKTQLAKLSSLATVAEARALLAAKVAAGQVRSKKGMLRRIIESGEAASEVLDKVRKAANRAAKKRDAAAPAQLAAVGNREMSADETDAVALREKIKLWDDSQLAAQWGAMVQAITDKGTQANFRRAHYAEANGHLRERILDGRVARRAMLEYLEKHG